MKIVAIADSDSYLKWACATLDHVAGNGAGGSEWEREVLLIRSPILPVDTQIEAAVAGTFADGTTPRILSKAELGAALAAARPDVVLAAATGPAAQQILAVAARLPYRPVLVSGLPGVGLPATTKALRFRALTDVFIAHSHAEQEAFRQVARKLHMPLRVLVSTLPFLDPARHEGGVPRPSGEPLRSVVFAAQAKVPVERSDREEILLALAELSRARPEVAALVKLRARAGEQQTHNEDLPYDDLWADLVRSGRVAGGEVEFVYGAMAEHLGPGSSLVTVSSTALLEAIDAGRPVLVIGDFGVDDSMLNRPFADSGCIGTLADVSRGELGFPDPEWLAENYFHSDEDPLGDSLGELVGYARADELPSLKPRLRRQRRRTLRSEIRMALPMPALRALRRFQAAVRK